MSIIAWVVIGGFAGWGASVILHERKGLRMYVTLGMVGAFVGGFTFSAIGRASMTGFNFNSLFAAVVGSVALIVLLRAVRPPRTTS